MTEKEKPFDKQIIEKPFKTVLIGDSQVGKSTLIHKFIYDEFKTNSNSTIGVEFKAKPINHKDEETHTDTELKVHFWDTAGQERFRSIAKLYYRDAQAIFLMFDVTCMRSFESVKTWLDDIRSTVDPTEMIFFLIGTKIDLDSTREVHMSDVKKFITSTDMIDIKVKQYIEISTQENIGVDALFDTLIKKLVESVRRQSINDDSPHRQKFEIKKIKPDVKWNCCT
jgi:small GTP-binding protein